MPEENTPPGQGKGWGDGDAVRAFRDKRKRNPESTYTGFRPRVENEAAYYVIREWADHEQVNLSFSAIFNALLPKLMLAVQNTVERDEHGNISIDANFGRIEISR